LSQHENNSKKTKQLLGLKKIKGKNPPKQESFVFLERTVLRKHKTNGNPERNPR
jgi:hypothetical protein